MSDEEIAALVAENEALKGKLREAVLWQMDTMKKIDKLRADLGEVRRLVLRLA
jgi:hypothetical protein